MNLEREFQLLQGGDNLRSRDLIETSSVNLEEEERKKYENVSCPIASSYLHCEKLR